MCVNKGAFTNIFTLNNVNNWNRNMWKKGNLPVSVYHKGKLFCELLSKIQIMFSDKSDFPKQPETWKLNRLKQMLSPIVPELKIAWFYRIAGMFFSRGFFIKKVLLLCGLTFIVLYNFKLNGSPVLYVRYGPSPNFALIIRWIEAN